MWSVAVVLACGHCGLWFLAASRLHSPLLRPMQSPPCSLQADRAGRSLGIVCHLYVLRGEQEKELYECHTAFAGSLFICLLTYIMGVCCLLLQTQPRAIFLRSVVQASDMGSQASGLGQLASPGGPQPSTPGSRHQCPRWVHSGQSQPISSSSLPSKAALPVPFSLRWKLKLRDIKEQCDHPASELQPGFGPKPAWLYCPASSPAALPGGVLPEPRLISAHPNPTILQGLAGKNQSQFWPVALCSSLHSFPGTACLPSTSGTCLGIEDPTEKSKPRLCG